MDHYLQLSGKTGRKFYVTLNLSAPSKDLMGSLDITWVHCLMETCRVHSRSNERLQDVRRSYREKTRSGQEELVVSMSSTMHTNTSIQTENETPHWVLSTRWDIRILFTVGSAEIPLGIMLWNLTKQHEPEPRTRNPQPNDETNFK
jgi:hypothetical protein